MLTITVGDVLNESIPEDGVGKYCLYIFRDGDLILYVGKTSQHILDRIAEHLGLTYLMESQVGRLVEENAPESYSWCIDLLTLEECQGIIMHHFPLAVRTDLALAEQALILEYSPALNVLSNPHPRSLPRKYTRRRESRVKAAYKKVFNASK